MQFTHEVTLTALVPWRDIWAEWNDVRALPRLLSHVRAAAPDDHEDLARLVICLEGRELEFTVERTMCADRTLCWQSVGALFLYVLSLRLGTLPSGGGVTLTLTVAYDPPGFLPDIAESLGLSRKFGRELDADLRRYVHALESNCLANLALVD
jgi:uncharacterized membrane protein